MSLDDEARKAARRNTLRSLKAKRLSRLRQLKRQYEEQVREVNILAASDPERLRAKYAAGDYAKSEKRRRLAEKRIERYKHLMLRKTRLRPPSMAEEIFSSIVQGLAACMSIAALAIILYKASIISAAAFMAGAVGGAQSKTLFITTFAIFGGALTAMYIMSTLHHALPSPAAKEVFDRLTRCFVFVVLGAAYTSFTLNTVRTAAGWVMFGIVWSLSITGIVLYAAKGQEWAAVNCVLYLVVGWTGLIVVRELYHILPPRSFGFLITSGITYTVGLLLVSLQKVRFMHAIGDLVMLFGSAYFFLVLAFEILPD